MSTGQIALIVAAFMFVVIVIAGCSVATAVYSPDWQQPMYQEEYDD